MACVRSRDICGLCSFGSAGILTLATTCKTYAVGLKHEVRRATAVVVWRPSYSDVLRYIAKYVAKTDISWHLLRCLLRLSDDDDDDDDMPELIDLDTDVELTVTEHQSRGAVHTHM